MPRTHKNWLRFIDVIGVPELNVELQAPARSMIFEAEHLRARRVKVIRLPVKFSQTCGEVRCPAPLLDQHSLETQLRNKARCETGGLAFDVRCSLLSNAHWEARIDEDQSVKAANIQTEQPNIRSASLRNDEAQ